MPARMLRFGHVARQQQSAFRANLSAEARAPKDGVGRRHGHLLAHGSELENLYPAIRGDGGALDVFRERRIKWWTNARSGDRRKGLDYPGPTRNLASSQVSCVNFLLPLARIEGALAELLRAIDADVSQVELIVHEGRAAAVEFEWVGWNGPLEGGRSTRGSNQTSLDALILARTGNGRRRAYLLEWKYCEEYLRPENKGEGDSRQTRRRRYQGLFTAGGSGFNQSVSLEELFYEPFYQLARMRLVADRLLACGATETQPINEARVVVVCPRANADYRTTVASTPLGRRFPTHTTVQESFRAALRQPETFEVVAQEELVSHLRSGPLRRELRDWLDYHQLRYGW